MNYKVILLSGILALGLTSCRKVGCEPCRRLMRSPDFHDPIYVSFYYTDNPKEICDSCIGDIFYDILNPRTSTRLFDYGASPFTAKIKLLEKLSGIPTSVETLTHPDSAYIRPYIEWYQKKYINR